MNHLSDQAIVYEIKGSTIWDISSTYRDNRGILGGVYNILEVTARVYIHFGTFQQNYGFLGGAVH